MAKQKQKDIDCHFFLFRIDKSIISNFHRDLFLQTHLFRFVLFLVKVYNFLNFTLNFMDIANQKQKVLINSISFEKLN